MLWPFISIENWPLKDKKRKIETHVGTSLKKGSSRSYRQVNNVTASYQLCQQNVNSQLIWPQNPVAGNVDVEVISITTFPRIPLFGPKFWSLESIFWKRLIDGWIPVPNLVMSCMWIQRRFPVVFKWLPVSLWIHSHCPSVVICPAC